MCHLQVVTECGQRVNALVYHRPDVSRDSPIVPKQWMCLDSKLFFVLMAPIHYILRSRTIYCLLSCMVEKVMVKPHSLLWVCNHTKWVRWEWDHNIHIVVTRQNLYNTSMCPRVGITKLIWSKSTSKSKSLHNSLHFEHPCKNHEMRAIT